MNRYGKRLDYNGQRLTFLRLLRRAGIRAVPGQRGPSIHSFRHSFAVRRLTLWHRERRDVQELLPNLAVYLGHVGPENTYWYLRALPNFFARPVLALRVNRWKEDRTNDCSHSCRASPSDIFH